jgi:hypothetical protein
MFVLSVLKQAFAPVEPVTDVIFCHRKEFFDSTASYDEIPCRSSRRFLYDSGSEVLGTVAKRYPFDVAYRRTSTPHNLRKNARSRYMIS